MRESAKKIMPLGLIGVIVIGVFLLTLEAPIDSEGKGVMDDTFFDDFSAGLDVAAVKLHDVTNSDGDELQAYLHELKAMFLLLDEQFYEGSAQYEEIEYSRVFEELTFITTGRNERDRVPGYEGEPFYYKGELSAGERAFLQTVATDFQDVSFMHNAVDTPEAFNRIMERVVNRDYPAFYEKNLEKYEDNTLHDSFHAMMNQHGDREERPYSVLYMDEGVLQNNDGIVVFTEENNQGEQVFLVYLEKMGQHWHWKHSLGANVKESGINWRISHGSPHFYAGMVNDKNVERVAVDGQEATIISINDDDRFWFIHASEGDVVYRNKDGTERVIDSSDF
ncbi:hypothetical protein JSY36_05780 [Bacillus sp. H-16]|uniref:hypothetical protein n=1 Tax=Alteribacter salitolerans TaxID=2912333 RepID=UPI001964BBEF|nr:hypothetical protein [Alteribacter salitolerans]MBM7095260.1 hypothetical protein [Alteribacter salitolerans]